MEITITSKSRVGKSSEIKKMNKKQASEWFQNLSPAEQSLLKQQANSSSSLLKEIKHKKEMHERERQIILKRRSEHEARMKAQLKSKAEITQQIQHCQQLRRQLIPFQMRLAQMQLHESYCASRSLSEFFYNLGNLDSKVSNELRFIKNEEKVLFDMQHKHHCIKNSIKDIVAKTTALSYTRIQAKNSVDNVYNLV